jgi:hypothetical protein
MSFGTFPSIWIKEGGLKEWSPRAGVVGRSIAALKCYAAMAAYRDYRLGTAILSSFDLGKIAGLSKPTVLEGVLMLQAGGLVSIDRVKNVNRYTFASGGAGFRKIPQDAICRGLPEIGNRNPRNLAAMKIYMALLYLRDEETNTATVSHSKLVEYTGVRSTDVAAATSILVAAGLSHIRQSDEWSKTGHPTNAYHLLGDFTGKRQFVTRPSVARRSVPF